MQKRTLGNTLQTLFAVIAGNVLFALTVKLFLLPAGLAAGGTTGIGLVVEHFTGIPIPLTVLVFNVSMLILGWILLGKAFALTTVVSSFAYPIALECFDKLLGTLVLTEDIFLCTLFSGLGVGAALGIVIRAGASTGGMDIPPLILNRHFRFPVTTTLYVFDVIILLCQASFNTWDRILYGIFYIIIYTMVLDKLLLFGKDRTEIRVISDRAEEIREAILRDVDRGCTIIYGQGGYSRQDIQIVMSVISSRELPKAERLIHSIDPASFIILSKASEVHGRGFDRDKVDPR